MKSRLTRLAALIGMAAAVLISIAVYRSGSQPALEPSHPELRLKPEQEAEPTGSGSAGQADRAEAAIHPSPLPAAPPPKGTVSVPARPVAPPGQRRPAPTRPFALRITGTVEDQQGQPLEEALLRWIPLDSSQIWPLSYDSDLVDRDASELPPGALRDALKRGRATLSDSQGRFALEFDALERPMGVVAATAPGHEIKVKRVAIPDLKGRSLEGAAQRGLEVVMDFRLGFAGVVSGTVRDRVSGAAAQGMAVAAVEHQPGRPPAASLSGRAPAALVDAEGRYAIRGLPPGEYWIAPKTGQSDYVSVSFPKGRKVILEAGSEISQLDFEVDRGGRISGRFVDSDGGPVARVFCKAIPSNLSAMAMSGSMEYLEIVNQPRQRTPQDGSFEFRGLRLGVSYRIQGRADGLANAVSEPVGLTERSPQAELEVVMALGSTISGSVLRPDGQAAPGVHVIAFPEGSNPLSFIAADSPALAQCDEKGRYELQNVSAGKYRLLAGETLSPSLYLTVRRRARAEEAPPYIRVDVDGQTDLSGVVLTLEESEDSSLSGVVADDLGQPIEGASIKATSLSASLTSSVSAASGPDGAFEVPTQGDGPFRLEAQTKFSRLTVPDVEAGRKDLLIVLNRPGFVSGRVIAPGGAALPPGSRIEARPFADDDPQSLARRRFGPASALTAPSEDGSFRIEAPAGQAEIIARVPGFAPARSGPVAVRPGSDTPNVDLPLTQGAVLLGKVVHEDGSPLEGAEVRAVLDENDIVSQMSRSLTYGWMLTSHVTATDIDGQFELPHLPPGNYLVNASYADYTPSQSMEIELDEGQTRQIRLEIAVGGSISGLIVDEGLPRPGLAVLASSANLHSKATASDENGRFLLDGLASGEYVLNLFDLSGGRQRLLKTLHVAVQEGESVQVEIDLAGGQRVFGSVGGGFSGYCRILLRRPGSTPLQDLSAADFVQALLTSEGSIQVRSPSGYELPGINPGRYSLEVYRLPADPSNMADYQSLDRTPIFQQLIAVGDQDVQVDIVIR